MKKKILLTVYIEQDEDGVYIGSIPSIPNCHAQGNSQEEMFKNLTEVTKLCLRNSNKQDIQKHRFIGIQNLEGISASRAKKNTFAIKLLKKHGRAFSI